MTAAGRQIITGIQILPETNYGEFKFRRDIANTIMQSMIHLPSTLAPMVRGMDNVEVINNVIDTEIRKVLEGLSDTPLPAYLLLQDEDDEEAEEE